MAIIDAESVEAWILKLQAFLEIVPVARGFWRPDDFGEGTKARKNHVLDVREVGHVFGPDVSLRAENVPLGLGGQFGGYRLEGIYLFHWKKATNGMWLCGVIPRLVVIEVTIIQRRH